MIRNCNIMNKTCVFRYAIGFIFAGVVMTACQGSQQQAEVQQPVLPELMPQMPVIEAQPQTTTMLGKVVATRYADLSFQTSLPILRMLVKNGQQVRQGQLIAELDMFKLKNSIEVVKRQIEQSELQMKDVIIAQGYDPDKPASVPAEVLNTAEVKSGYQLAKEQLNAAEHELQTAVLTAPFAGIVANVKAQAHELSQPGQPVCRIISTQDMAVEFRVMEADLPNYPLGTAIQVCPLAYKGRQYQAIVNEINPIVDQQGAITLRAKLAETHDLYDGMNVEVLSIDK